jgi:hypothetical protein
VLLGVGELVELDGGAGVGQAEALERGEDGVAGGSRGAAFGQQLRELLVIAERGADRGLDQSEDQQGDPDGADSAWTRSSLCRKIGRTFSASSAVTSARSRAWMSA